MKKTNVLLLLCLTMATFFYTACKKDKKDDTPAAPAPAPTTTPSLYDRVGGTATVSDPKNNTQMIEKGRLTLRSVVDSAIYVIAGDTAMTKYFGVLLAEVGSGNTTGFAALSKNLTDFLCVATGAKNSAYAYTGKSMKAAHDPATNPRIGMKVNSADFDRFVGDVGTALAKNGVNSTNNKPLVDDLVALLYTTKNDVVQR